ADGKATEKVDADRESVSRFAALSRDGKAVVCVVTDPAANAQRLTVLDLGGGPCKELAVAGLPEKDFTIDRVRGSPDGKRLAFVYQAVTPSKTKPNTVDRVGDANLCVVDADGKNLKVIRKEKMALLHDFELR